jgi:hypothetical protein
MMESIEKAREAIRKDAFTNANLSKAFNMGGSSEYADTIEGVFNAIEAEIAERYIELPMDADGVPIHIGDSLASDEYGGERFVCFGLNVDGKSGKNYWTVGMDYNSYSNTSEYASAMRCHHVKPRTVEDVLYECFHDCMYKYPLGIEPIISKYAAEIRELPLNELVGVANSGMVDDA